MNSLLIYVKLDGVSIGSFVALRNTNKKLLCRVSLRILWTSRRYKEIMEPKQQTKQTPKLKQVVVHSINKRVRGSSAQNRPKLNLADVGAAAFILKKFGDKQKEKFKVKPGG